MSARHPPPGSAAAPPPGDPPPGDPPSGAPPRDRASAPPLDPSLDPATLEDTDPEAAALLGEVLRVAREGGDLDALIARHPAHATRIRGWLDAVGRIGLGAPSSGAGSTGSAPALLVPGPPAIEGYTVLRELARGAMGVVYRARHHALGREVAVKVLRVERLVAAARARFDKEARAAARLQHPRIVAIHDVGEDAQGRPYYTMDLVEGRSLAEVIHDQGGPLPPDRAATIVRKVAEALDYAHQQGIVHRDLKPANLLIDRRGEVFVTDFGLARDLHEAEGATRTGDVLGTPAYMSPEQTVGDPSRIDARTDVWALGVILYEMLAGRRPLEGSGPALLARIGEEAPAPLRRAAPGVPRDLAVIAHKALEPDKERRYRTAGALADDLARWAAAEPIRARPPGGLYVASKWVRRHPGGVLAAALLVAAIALAATFVVERRADARRARARDEVAAADEAHAAGRWSEARTRAAAALALDPDAPGGRALLASAALALGDPAGALAALGTSPAPSDDERLLRARALLAAARPGEALEVLASLPEGVAVLVARADALGALGRTAEADTARARGETLSALELDRDAAAARAALARGDAAHARALVAAALARRPDHPGALETEAALRLAARDAPGALQLIEGLAAPSALGQRTAARAEMALGRPDRAALRLAPLALDPAADPDLVEVFLEARLQRDGAAFFRFLADQLARAVPGRSGGAGASAEPASAGPGGASEESGGEGEAASKGSSAKNARVLADLDRIALDAATLRARHPEHAGGYLVGARLGLLFRGLVIGTVEEDLLAALRARFPDHPEGARLAGLARDLASARGPDGRPYGPLDRLDAHEDAVGGALGLPSPALLIPPPLPVLARAWRDGDGAAGAALAARAGRDPAAVDAALRTAWAGAPPGTRPLDAEPLARDVAAQLAARRRADLASAAEAFDPGTLAAAAPGDVDALEGSSASPPAAEPTAAASPTAPIGDVDALVALATSDEPAWRAALGALATHGPAGREALVRLAGRGTERVALSVAWLAHLAGDRDLLELLRARPEPLVQTLLDAASGAPEAARALDLLSPSDARRQHAVEELFGSWGLRIRLAMPDVDVVYWWFPAFLERLQRELSGGGDADAPAPAAAAPAWLDAHRALLRDLAPKVDGPARLALSLVLARAGSERDLELIVRLAAVEPEARWRDSLLLHALLHAAAHPEHVAGLDLDRPALRSQGSRFLLAVGAWERGLALLRGALRDEASAKEALDWLARFPVQMAKLREADERIPELTRERKADLAALVAVCLDRAPLSRSSLAALAALGENPLPEVAIERLADLPLRDVAARLVVATAPLYTDADLERAAACLQGSQRWAIRALRAARPGSPPSALDALLAESVAWDEVLTDLAQRVLATPTEEAVAVAAALLLRQPDAEHAHGIIERLGALAPEVLTAGLSRAAAARDPVTRLGAVYAFAALDTGVLARLAAVLKLDGGDPIGALAGAVLHQTMRWAGAPGSAATPAQRTGLPEAMRQALADDAYRLRGCAFPSLELARCLFAAEHGLRELAPSIARTVRGDPLLVAHADEQLSARGWSKSGEVVIDEYGYAYPLRLDLHLCDLAAWCLARLLGAPDIYPVPPAHLPLEQRGAARRAVLARAAAEESPSPDRVADAAGARAAGLFDAAEPRTPVAIAGFEGDGSSHRLGVRPGDLVHAIDDVPVRLPLRAGAPYARGAPFAPVRARVSRAGFHYDFVGRRGAEGGLPFRLAPDPTALLLRARPDALGGALQLAFGPKEAEALLDAAAEGALDEDGLARLRDWLAASDPGDETFASVPVETWLRLVDVPGLFVVDEAWMERFVALGEGLFQRGDPDALRREAEPALRFLPRPLADEGVESLLAALEAGGAPALPRLRALEHTADTWVWAEGRPAAEVSARRARAAAVIERALADGEPSVRAAALRLLRAWVQPLGKSSAPLFGAALARLDDPARAVRLAVAPVFAAACRKGFVLDEHEERAFAAAFAASDDAALRAALAPVLARADAEARLGGERSAEVRRALYARALEHPVTWITSAALEREVVARTAALLPQALADGDEGVRAFGLLVVARVADLGKQERRRPALLDALPRVLDLARCAASERERRRAYWTLVRARGHFERRGNIWAPRPDGIHEDLRSYGRHYDPTVAPETERFLEDRLSWLPPPTATDLDEIAAWVDAAQSGGR